MKISVELLLLLRGKSISHVDEKENRRERERKKWNKKKKKESEINGWVQISGNKEKILGSSAKTLCFNLCKKFRKTRRNDSMSVLINGNVCWQASSSLSFSLCFSLSLSISPQCGQVNWKRISRTQQEKHKFAIKNLPKYKKETHFFQVLLHISLGKTMDSADADTASYTKKNTEE